MSAPLGKKTRFPGASRPWLVKEPQETKTYEVHRTTPKEAKEREACLNCKLPDCMPFSEACPVAPERKRKHPGLKPPTEFLDWAWGPMSNQEWADKCGVSVSTIQRWRQHYAREIHRRKKNRP